MDCFAAKLFTTMQAGYHRSLLLHGDVVTILNRALTGADMSFLAKVKQRKVFQVAVVYAVTAWIIVQIIVTIKEPLNLPVWSDTLVIVILAVGFPVALILAWMLEPKLHTNTVSTGTAVKEAEAGKPDSDDRIKRGDIRFCTTPEGYRLAYSRVGGGTPLLRTGNWLSHQELEWNAPILRHYLRDLSRKFEMITYDGRGTGLSDREVSEFSLETMVKDMEVVVDANELSRFAILAYSQSCAVSIAYAVRHPERVSHMVLFGGFAQNFRTQEEIDAMATLFKQSWGQANVATRQLFTSAVLPDATKEESDAFNELQKQSISPESAARLFRACHSFDVREQAKLVSVPTLVMHSRDEQGVPVEYGREMAALIPNARFVPLDSRNHIVLEREPAYQRFLDEIISFIQSGNKH